MDRKHSSITFWQVTMRGDGDMQLVIIGHDSFNVDNGTFAPLSVNSVVWSPDELEVFEHVRQGREESQAQDAVTNAMDMEISAFEISKSICSRETPQRPRNRAALTYSMELFEPSHAISWRSITRNATERRLLWLWRRSDERIEG